MVWLVGCNGMLGSEISRQLKEGNIDYVGTGHEVDFTDISEIKRFVEGKQIDVIVNCAAYTAVDKAESEPELASKVNETGPRNLSVVASGLGAVLIHVSTDYVFDKCDSSVFSPIVEDEPVCPTSVYGETKANGEKAVAENTGKFYILRTAWLYGWKGKNFVYTMIRAMNSHESVKVVNDQKGSPTFAGNLACVILKIIERFKNGDAIPYGIYHCTDSGEISWFDFTNEIKRQGIECGLINETGKACKVNPCTTEEYPTPAKRPSYSVLSKDKLQSALDINLPDWKQSLSDFLKSDLFEKDRIK